MKKRGKLSLWRYFRGKNYRYLATAVMCVSLLLIASIFAVYFGEQANQARYQSENYEKLRENSDRFKELLSKADKLLDTFESAAGEEDIAFWAQASGEEIDATISAPSSDGILWMHGEPLFTEHSPGNKLCSRMNAFTGNVAEFEAFLIYAPASGYALGSLSEGALFFLAHSDEELYKVFTTAVRWKSAQDASLILVPGMTEGEQILYYMRYMSNGLILLFGIDTQALQKTLFADSFSSSYKLEQMLLHLPNGGLGYREEAKQISFLGRTWDVLTNREDISQSNTYTVMRYVSDQPYFTLSVVMSETGTAGIISAALFVPFVIINGLWLFLVAFICVYVLTHFNRPIEEILEEIHSDGKPDGDLSEEDQLAVIESAIRKYNQDIKAKQRDVEEQRTQLKHLYLGKLALDQSTYLSEAQLETLRIPQLLSRYMLVVLYPDNGRWTDDSVSEQEQAYQRYVTIMAVQEAMRTNMLLTGAEYMICHMRLLIIVPVDEATDEELLHQKATDSAKLIGVNLKMRLQIGFSKIRGGMETFSHSYRDALKRATLVEEKEYVRSEDINLSELLKQNMHIADLIYIEHYSGALTSFRDIIHTLFRQQNAGLRRQQLQSFQTLIVCMLTETSEINAQQLEQLDAQLERLMQTEDEDALLDGWSAIFGQLEEQKSKKKISQYSEQFAAVYQYMHVHFRDPDLSLSRLSEEFGMSLSVLSREFQKNLGKGFLESLHQMRIDEAKYQIEQTNMSLSDIAEDVGYTNVLTMTRAFKKYLGNTPGSYRKSRIAPSP